MRGTLWWSLPVDALNLLKSTPVRCGAVRCGALPHALRRGGGDEP